MTLFLSPFVGKSICAPQNLLPRLWEQIHSHTPQNVLPRFHQNLQSSESDFEIWLLHYDGFVWLVWLLISVLKNLSVTILMPYHLNGPSKFTCSMEELFFFSKKLGIEGYSFLVLSKVSSQHQTFSLLLPTKGEHADIASENPTPRPEGCFNQICNLKRHK